MINIGVWYCGGFRIYGCGGREGLQKNMMSQKIVGRHGSMP